MQADHARIARLETQVESLRDAVRALADVLSEHLAGDGIKDRVAGIEGRVEEMAQLQAAHGRVIRRQEERLKKALVIVAQALSASDPV